MVTKKCTTAGRELRAKRTSAAGRTLRKCKKGDKDKPSSQNWKLVTDTGVNNSLTPKFNNWYNEMFGGNNFTTK